MEIINSAFSQDVADTYVLPPHGNAVDVIITLRKRKKYKKHPLVLVLLIQELTSPFVLGRFANMFLKRYSVYIMHG